VASLDGWMDTLRTRLPGADDNVINLELRNAIREFCTQSGAFLKRVELALKQDKNEYNLNPQPEGNVLWVHQIYSAKGFEYVLVDDERLARVGMNRAYCPSPGTIQISPTPDADADKKDGLVVWVGMVPNFNIVNLTVPDEFETAWFDHILDGALFRMHSQHKRPWTNPLSAQYHAKRFRNGMAQARDVTRRRFSNAESSFLFPPWGNLPRERSRW